MPIPAISHLVPAGGKDYPLLEDFHLMGSYRVVATIDDRNALHQRKRKAFMLCATIATRKVYWLDADLTTWHDAFAFNLDGTLDFGNATGGGGGGSGSSDLFSFTGRWVAGAGYKRGDVVIDDDPNDPTRQVLWVLKADSLQTSLNRPHLDFTVWESLGDKITYVKGDKGDKGDKGERGDRGPVGDRGADGKSLNMRGAWQQTAVYYQNDVVVAPAGEGKLGLYCLKVANANGNLPGNEPDKWTCFLVTLDVDAYSADVEAIWHRYSQSLDDGNGHGSIPTLNKVVI